MRVVVPPPEGVVAFSRSGFRATFERSPPFPPRGRVWPAESRRRGQTAPRALREVRRFALAR